MEYLSGGQVLVLVTIIILSHRHLVGGHMAAGLMVSELCKDANVK